MMDIFTGMAIAFTAGVLIGAVGTIVVGAVMASSQASQQEEFDHAP